MKKVILNVGLGNNPYGFDVLRDYFSDGKSAKVVDYAVGQWDGCEEPTCVVSIEMDGDVREFVERLCGWTTQTAIAVKVDGVGDLVYEPSYQGERYTFDERYFITPTVELKGGYSDYLIGGTMIFLHPDNRSNKIVHGEFECDGEYYYHRFEWEGVRYVVKARG